MDSANRVAIYRRALEHIVELAEINQRFDHVWAISHCALADAEDEKYPYVVKEKIEVKRS